jgi:hypothetical protein
MSKCFFFPKLQPNAGPQLRVEVSLHPTLFPPLNLWSQQMDTHLINCLDSVDICSSAPMQHTEEDLPIIGIGPNATAPASALNSVPNHAPMSTSAAAPAPASAPCVSVSVATLMPHAPVAPESSRDLASGHLGLDHEQILHVGSPVDEDAGVMCDILPLSKDD